MDRRKLAIGFVVYGQTTSKYLSYFLPSLFEAAEKCGLDTMIMAWDNGPSGYQINRDILKQYESVIILGQGDNLGFAEANNQLINTAREAGANYFLALNPDMLLESDVIRELLRPMETDSRLASVSPKVRHWNFETNEKTDLIDTCGIVIKSGLQFQDLGQGQIDLGQFDYADIAGPSGCAALYRLSALAKVKTEHGYFDNRIFMYKEDCDLVYRLQQAKLKSAVARLAIIYHDRSAAAGGQSLLAKIRNQQSKSPNVRRWSFYSQWFLFFKHWSSLNWLAKSAVIYQAAQSLVYAIIFDQKLLSEIKRAHQVLNPKSDI